MLFKFGKQAKSGMSSAESEERLRLSVLLGRLPPESGTSQRTVLPGYFAASASASCAEMSSPRRIDHVRLSGDQPPSETLYEQKNHTAAAREQEHERRDDPPYAGFGRSHLLQIPRTEHIGVEAPLVFKRGAALMAGIDLVIAGQVAQLFERVAEIERAAAGKVVPAADMRKSVSPVKSVLAR